MKIAFNYEQNYDDFGSNVSTCFKLNPRESSPIQTFNCIIGCARFWQRCQCHENIRHRKMESASLRISKIATTGARVGCLWVYRHRTGVINVKEFIVAHFSCDTFTFSTSVTINITLAPPPHLPIDRRLECEKIHQKSLSIRIH